MPVNFGVLEAQPIRGLFSRAQVKNSALSAGCDGESRSRCGCSFDNQAIEIFISMGRIMVEWHELLDVRQRREGQSMRKRAMPPANMAGIFLAAVLRIMDEQIDTCGHGIA